MLEPFDVIRYNGKVSFRLNQTEKDFLRTKRWYLIFRTIPWLFFLISWFFFFGAMIFGTGGQRVYGLWDNFLLFGFPILVAFVLTSTFYAIIYAPLRGLLISKLYKDISEGGEINKGDYTNPFSRVLLTLLISLIVFALLALWWWFFY